MKKQEVTYKVVTSLKAVLCLTVMLAILGFRTFMLINSANDLQSSSYTEVGNSMYNCCDLGSLQHSADDEDSHHQFSFSVEFSVQGNSSTIFILDPEEEYIHPFLSRGFRIFVSDSSPPSLV